jgi:hypothetical protein
MNLKKALPYTLFGFLLITFKQLKTFGFSIDTLNTDYLIDLTLAMMITTAIGYYFENNGSRKK